MKKLASQYQLHDEIVLLIVILLRIGEYIWLSEQHHIENRGLTREQKDDGIFS